jgi:hypothetical protein
MAVFILSRLRIPSLSINRDPLRVAGASNRWLRSPAFPMETVQKLKYLSRFYLSVLLVLLLCAAFTPLVIRHGISVTRRFIIEEDVLESVLIVILFGISYLILRGFNHTLKAYERTGEEKCRLASQLTDAFTYIGTVNVEIQEIQSILCGVERYPQSQKEFRELLDGLAVKGMAVAGTRWIVIRIINRCSGRTVTECAIERQKGALPPAVMGNRAILEGREVEGMTAIGSSGQNPDLLTVCILPTSSIPEDARVLMTAITNQIEMLFMLYRAGCIPREPSTHETEKETYHDTHY